MYFLKQLKTQFFQNIVKYQESPEWVRDSWESGNKPEDIRQALTELQWDIDQGKMWPEFLKEYDKKIQEVEKLITHVRLQMKPIDSVKDIEDIDTDDIDEISNLSTKQYELRRTLYEFDEQIRDIRRTLETIERNRLSEQEFQEYQIKTNIDFLSLPAQDRLRFVTVGNIDAKTLQEQEFQGLEFTFTYDGVFNKELYIRTTAGQVLPSEVRKIQSGSETFIRRWIDGEFFTESGKRLKIHEGTKIDILEYAESEALTKMEQAFSQELEKFAESEKIIALAALKKGIDPKFFLLLFANKKMNDTELEDVLTDISRYEDDFMDYFPGNTAFENGKVTESFAWYVFQLLWQDMTDIVQEYEFNIEAMKKFRRVSQSPWLGWNIDLSQIDITDVSPEELQRILHLNRYNKPMSREAVILFTAATQSAGLPSEWAKNPKLHHILQEESAGWQVWILNYTITQNTGHTTESFRDISMRRRVKNPIGVRSTASGLGQLTLSNVDLFYPDGRAGIWDPLNEAVGMLRYIRDRYGDIDTAYSVYGRKWSYTHAVTGQRRQKTFKEGY